MSSTHISNSAAVEEKVERKRQPISTKQRFRILQRDNFRCRYCGKTGEEAPLEMDHRFPFSKGGDNSDANLVTACRECNSGKHAAEIQDPPVMVLTVMDLHVDLDNAFGVTETYRDDFSEEPWRILELFFQAYGLITELYQQCHSEGRLDEKNTAAWREARSHALRSLQEFWEGDPYEGGMQIIEAMVGLTEFVESLSPTFGRTFKWDQSGFDRIECFGDWLSKTALLDPPSRRKQPPKESE